MVRSDKELSDQMKKIKDIFTCTRRDSRLDKATLFNAISEYLDDYADSHPEEIREVVLKSLDGLVNIKDVVIGDNSYFCYRK